MPGHKAFAARWPSSAMGIAAVTLLMVSVEAWWGHRHPIWANFPSVRHLVVSATLAPDDRRRVVHAQASGRGDLFALNAGDRCLFLDDAASAWPVAASGDAQVPVFCPARGAGWASRAYLRESLSSH